jgi:hypothetical protein
MVFGIIPECRSASLRKERSASPESPAPGYFLANDNDKASMLMAITGFDDCADVTVL